MNIEQDIDFELDRLRKVAWRMDALFTIPKTRITIGLDNILGLVPVIGDLLALLPSAWMIHKAYKLGATRGTLAYMTLNTMLDLLIGAIPIIGDIFDVLYNANIRNFNALKVNLNQNAQRARSVGGAKRINDALA